MTDIGIYWKIALADRDPLYPEDHTSANFQHYRHLLDPNMVRIRLVLYSVLFKRYLS